MGLTDGDRLEPSWSPDVQPVFGVCSFSSYLEPSLCAEGGTCGEEATWYLDPEAVGVVACRVRNETRSRNAACSEPVTVVLISGVLSPSRESTIASRRHR